MNDEVKERIEQLRPVDDIFFEKIMEDKEVCQEILRVILEDRKLVVISVTPQKSIRNLQGRSARLDVECTLADGSVANVEVQISDKDDHPRRVRYYASCITANVTEPGTNFKDVPDLYMVYITRFDLFKRGKTIYHVRPTLLETGEVVDNGLHEIYVNTVVKEQSEISELMDCFEQTMITSRKFPKLADRVNYFKRDEEGENVMSQIIEEYAMKVAEREKAEQLVTHVETVAKKVGSVELACEMLDIAVPDYIKAKRLAEEVSA